MVFAMSDSCRVNLDGSHDLADGYSELGMWMLEGVYRGFCMAKLFNM